MDDTLENLSEVWIKRLNKKYRTKVDPSQIVEWDITKFFPTLTKKQIFSPLKTRKLWKKVRPLPGACEYLKKLKDNGHKIVVVTSSAPETLYKKLNLFLFKYFPYLSEEDVIVTYNKQMINGDILIDDAPHNLIGGNYFKILMTTSHNKNFNDKKANMLRVDNWEEIYNVITNLSILSQIKVKVNNSNEKEEGNNDTTKDTKVGDQE